MQERETQAGDNESGKATNTRGGCSWRISSRGRREECRMWSREEDERLVEVESGRREQEYRQARRERRGEASVIVRCNRQFPSAPASCMKWHAQVGSTNDRTIQSETAEPFNSLCRILWLVSSSQSFASFSFVFLHCESSMFLNTSNSQLKHRERDSNEGRVITAFTNQLEILRNRFIQREGKPRSR
jgi:hypothetical protein